MNLISCDNCGAVFDKNKLKFPDPTNDFGEIIDGRAVWDGDCFVAIIDCPVCKTGKIKEHD